MTGGLKSYDSGWLSLFGSAFNHLLSQFYQRIPLSGIYYKKASEITGSKIAFVCPRMTKFVSFFVVDVWVVHLISIFRAFKWSLGTWYRKFDQFSPSFYSEFSINFLQLWWIAGVICPENEL